MPSVNKFIDYPANTSANLNLQFQQFAADFSQIQISSTHFNEIISGDKKLPIQNQNQPSSRYKTELCRPFEEFSSCKYGDKCQFAHGSGELRSLNRHPKYKTELCRTFHTMGLCPYGHRCHFIHNSEEEIAIYHMLIQQQQQQQQQQLQMNQNLNHSPTQQPPPLLYPLMSSSSSSSSQSSGGSSPTHNLIQPLADNTQNHIRLPVFWNLSP